MPTAKELEQLYKEVSEQSLRDCDEAMQQANRRCEEMGRTEEAQQICQTARREANRVYLLTTTPYMNAIGCCLGFFGMEVYILCRDVIEPVKRIKAKKAFW